MQIKLTQIVDTPKTSQKTGKPYVSRSILCNEYGERWISGFAGKDNANWKVGDTVEVNIEDTGKYLNFTVPRASSTYSTAATPGFVPPAGDLNRIEAKVDLLRSALSTLGGQMTDVQGVLGDILRKVSSVDDINAEPF